MDKIFVHGLGQTASSWEKTIRCLNDAAQVRCIDLVCGDGHSAVTYESLYQKLCRECNGIEGKVDLCGLSLGGVLSLNYAIDFPDKINSLVLINAQYKMPKLLLKMQSIIFRFIPSGKFDAMGFSKRDFLTLSQSMERLSLQPSLSRVVCPTLILYGQKDRVNKKAAIDLSRLIRQSRLEAIAAAGHEINIEQPGYLGEALNVFYASVDGSNQ